MIIKTRQIFKRILPKKETVFIKGPKMFVYLSPTKTTTTTTSLDVDGRHKHFGPFIPPEPVNPKVIN